MGVPDGDCRVTLIVLYGRGSVLVELGGRGNALRVELDDNPIWIFLAAHFEIRSEKVTL